MLGLQSARQSPAPAPCPGGGFLTSPRSGDWRTRFPGQPGRAETTSIISIIFIHRHRWTGLNNHFIRALENRKPNPQDNPTSEQRTNPPRSLRPSRMTLRPGRCVTRVIGPRSHPRADKEDSTSPGVHTDKVRIFVQFPYYSSQPISHCR